MSTTSRSSPTTPATSHTPKAVAPRRAIRIEEPAQLISLVPYLLGFHPGQDIVIIGTAQPGHVARVTVRYSLDPAAVTDQVRHALALLSGRHYDTAAAVGYGADKLVTPFMDWLRIEAKPPGITFTELLRVDTEQQRYWSYTCDNSDCCTPDGTPYDPSPDPALAAMLVEGASGVLASREALADSIATATDEEVESMERATRMAERRIIRLSTQATKSGTQPSSHHIAKVGITAIRRAIRTYRHGSMISCTEAAWLTVSLRDPWVRDDACARMDPKSRNAHLRLWTDLTRLARPGYLVAPATLLAFVAWQAGNGVLANVALDRALKVDPDYPLATALRQVVDGNAWPVPWPLMAPEAVAESYTRSTAG